MKTLGRTLTLDRVAAMDGLLDKFAADPRWSDLRHVAYAFATMAAETDWTFRPIREYGRGKGKAYGVKDPKTGEVYYGRGYVQLTWKDNYQKASTKLGVDLVNFPDRAMEPEIAFEVMTLGMHEGWFAGDKKGRHTLSRWIGDGHCDYVGARRIINGTDHKDEIAGFARRFETALKAAMEPTATAEAVATVAGEDEPDVLPSWTDIADKATTAVDAFDTADRVVSGFSDRRDKAKGFWAKAGGKITQMLWLLISAVAGMPWWAWLMVAAMILAGFYGYRRRARIGKALAAAWKRVRSMFP